MIAELAVACIMEGQACKPPRIYVEYIILSERRTWPPKLKAAPRIVAEDCLACKAPKGRK